jgi:hypothetical protein
MRPDPYLTDAEFYVRRRAKSGPYAGMAAVQVNLSETIGGLARLDHSEAQEAAAQRFRSIWDAAQLGGSRAVDYAAVKVDTSGPQNDRVMEAGIHARARYSEAVRFLGMIRSSLVERVVIHDEPIAKIAGNGSRARARTTAELLSALDDLAKHFSLA